MTNERQPPLFSQPAQSQPPARPGYQQPGATISLGHPTQPAADAAADDERAMRIPVRDRTVPPPSADDRLMDYAPEQLDHSYREDAFGPANGRRSLADRVRAATENGLGGLTDGLGSVSRRLADGARYSGEQARTYLGAMPKQHAIAGTMVLLLGGMIGFALGQWSGPSAVAADRTLAQTQQRPIIQQSAAKPEDMTPPQPNGVKPPSDKAPVDKAQATRPPADKAPADKAKIDKAQAALPKSDPRRDPVKLEATKPELIKEPAKADEPKSKATVDPATPAWRRFAATTVDPAGRPMIAIIVDDLGSDPRRTARVAKLPATLTLGLSAKGSKDLDTQAATARKAGHELLALVPMEPTSSSVDPGPRALTVKQSNDEIRKNLDWHLSRFNGYVGVANHMGSKFTADPARMSVVMGDARKRGVLFVDAVTTGKSTAQATAQKANVPYVARDVFVEAGKNSAADAQLKRLEDIARKRGYAVGIARADDATLAALQTWLPDAKKRGIAFVPISALIQNQASTRQSAAKD